MPAPRSASAPAAGTGPRCPRHGRPMGRPPSPDYWRRWRAAHPAYRERERERARARRRAGYRSPKTQRPRLDVEPIAVPTHPLLAWAHGLATDLVGRTARGAASPTSSTPMSSPSFSWPSWSGRTPWPEPPPGCERSGPGEATWRRCSRLPDGRWHAHGSAPVGAASTTPVPAAGPRRTSDAATAAAARVSPTASGGRPGPPVRRTSRSPQRLAARADSRLVAVRR